MIAVEDNLPDVFLIEEALAAHKLTVELKNFRDGEEAIYFIRSLDADETRQCPALFLLDLNIPIRNGHEVLAAIRSSKCCAGTPVVVVTSSHSSQDRQTTERLGVSHYFCKPTDYDAFMLLGAIVHQLLGS